MGVQRSRVYHPCSRHAVGAAELSGGSGIRTLGKSLTNRTAAASSDASSEEPESFNRAVDMTAKLGHDYRMDWEERNADAERTALLSVDLIQVRRISGARLRRPPWHFRSEVTLPLNLILATRRGRVCRVSPDRRRSR